MFKFECEKHGLVTGKPVVDASHLDLICPECLAAKCPSPVVPKPPQPPLDLLNYTGHVTLALNYVNKALEHLIEADRLAPNTRCESLSRTGWERLVLVRDYLWSQVGPYRTKED